MADSIKNPGNTRQQLVDLLDRLSDGIKLQIIQSEKDLEGFVGVMPEMQRELLGLQGLKRNPSLLEILGYSYGDADDHPVKKVVVGQISYSPDYVLRRDQKNLAILDLKAPDVDLDHSKWLGQISSYCSHLDALIGVLFNGRNIRVYINTNHKGLTRFKLLFSDQPVAEAGYRKQEQVVKILLKLSAPLLKEDPLAVARKMAMEQKKVIERESRRKQIQERVKSILTNPPNELLAAMSTVEGIWDGMDPEPSEQEVITAWDLKKSTPITVNAIEAVAKQSINAIVRQRVVEVCGRHGWQCIDDAKAKGLVKGFRYRFEGGNGYHPVAPNMGVPENLYIGGLSSGDAKKVIQQLESLL